MKSNKEWEESKEDFIYASDNNKEWMKPEELVNWIEKNIDKLGEI